MFGICSTLVKPDSMTEIPETVPKEPERGHAHIMTPRLCRAARAFLGWTQKELSAIAQVSEQSIIDYEKENVRKFHVRTIARIRTAFWKGNLRFKLGIMEEGFTQTTNRLPWHEVKTTEPTFESPPSTGAPDVVSTDPV